MCQMILFQTSSGDSDNQDEEKGDEESHEESIESSSGGSDADDSDDESGDEESIGTTPEDHENETIDTEPDAGETVNEDAENQGTNTEEGREPFTFNEIKKNDVIRYRFVDSDWETVTVQGRAGKASGKNKHWWNVKEKDTGNEKAIDTENFEEVEKVIDNGQEQVEEAMVVIIPRHLHYQPD